MTIVNTKAPWVNADGLAVKFPDLEVVQGVGGEICVEQSPKLLEFDLDWEMFTTDISTAPDSATEVKIVDYNLVIPNGALIEQIEIVTTEAWTSGGSLTLNIGGVARSDYTTINDEDGFVDDLALASFNALNEKYVIILGTTGAGAYLTAAPTVDIVPCVRWGTAAPTAGTSKIRIFYR